MSRFLCLSPSLCPSVSITPTSSRFVSHAIIQWFLTSILLAWPLIANPSFLRGFCRSYFSFISLTFARARARWPIVANNVRTYCTGRPIIILSPAGSGCVNRMWAGGEGIMSAAFLLSCWNEDRKWSWKVCEERGGTERRELSSFPT